MESVSIPALGTQPVADGDLLRLLVAGSVDSGKSTLIGRLLYDAKLLLSDQIEALEVEGETLVVVAGSDCTGCADGPPAEDAVCVE